MRKRLYSTLWSCLYVTTPVVDMAVISYLSFLKRKTQSLFTCLFLVEITLLIEPLDDLGDTLLDRVLVSLDSDFGLLRLLVRCRNASEILDLTSAGLLVKALGVALLGDFEGHIDVDLNEGNGLVATLSSLLVQLTGDLAIRSVGGDEGGDSDGGRIGKELSNLGDTANVLVSVGLGKTKVLVEAEADVVAIETVGGDAQVEEVLLKSSGDGGLARGRETRQPDGETALTAGLVALLAR